MVQIEQHIAQKMEPFRAHLVFVACSGGVDSMVLSELLRKQGFQLELVHVNYGLRGADSEADMQHVLTYGEKHNIPVHVQTADPKLFQKNTQAKAREFRYAWFNELLAQHEKCVLVLAHHSDDQVETFFLNLARKSGVMGLACMPFQRGSYLRPLLDISKKELVSFARNQGITWREDISNAKLTYKRNILRSLLLPELTALSPELNENVLLLVRHFQEKQKDLETKLAPVASEWKNKRELPLHTWKSFDEHEKMELLRQIHQSAHLLSTIDLLVNGIKGAHALLEPSSNFPFKALAREANTLRLIASNGARRQAQLHVLEQASLPNAFDKDSIHLDADLLQGPLRLRTWELGDRMAPIGMKGTKLISEIIADAHIPFEEKDQVLVVCDDAHIHWCVGLKIGRMALASPQTSKILKCTLTFSTTPKSADL